MQERIAEVGRLSRQHWQGQWHTGCNGPGGERDGDYTATVPVLATTLALLIGKGPRGPVWWRSGHDTAETLDQALDNPGDHRAYYLRDEQRRATRRAEEEARDRQREENAAHGRRPGERRGNPGCGPIRLR